jgi:hypothetical protein
MLCTLPLLKLRRKGIKSCREKVWRERFEQ